MLIIAFSFVVVIIVIISVDVAAQKSAPATDPRRLQVGSKRPHPSHIPDFMPAFPDPHTYIRSVVRMHLILRKYHKLIFIVERSRFRYQ